MLTLANSIKTKHGSFSLFFFFFFKWTNSNFDLMMAQEKERDKGSAKLFNMVEIFLSGQKWGHGVEI